jgi:hypothetical protein
MTDDRQRIRALLAERAELIDQRDRCAQDLAELLEVARQVRVAAAASRDVPNGLALAIYDLVDVLERFDDA